MSLITSAMTSPVVRVLWLVMCSY